MMLSFQELRNINKKRSEIVFPQCRHWQINEWAVALFGEAGEVCDAVKKYNRGGDLDKHVVDIGKELADVVLYADLLANYLGINLGEAIKQKFNEVSDRHNSDIKFEIACRHKHTVRVIGKDLPESEGGAASRCLDCGSVVR